eukprot:366063-Chlamydomonas_euryale.AAC.6
MLYIAWLHGTRSRPTIMLSASCFRAPPPQRPLLPVPLPRCVAVTSALSCCSSCFPTWQILRSAWRGHAGGSMCGHHWADPALSLAGACRRTGVWNGSVG